MWGASPTFVRGPKCRARRKLGQARKPVKLKTGWLLAASSYRFGIDDGDLPAHVPCTMGVEATIVAAGAQRARCHLANTAIPGLLGNQRSEIYTSRGA